MARFAVSGARTIPENATAIGGPAHWWRAWSQALALLLAMAAAVAVALYLFVPPEVVPASAPVTEFSAERAMEDVRVIAKEPHPMGSPEHEEVADYIANRLEKLGLSPEVQETTGLRYNEGEQFHAGRVKNILARIPGTDNTGAVLLVGHHDSMPTTNADGGISTATVLETVRAIQAGPSLKNDVIVYVGDADVNGVIGATSYREHPWSQDVGVGFAFEGIGSYSPSALVYEGQAVADPGPDVSTSPQTPDLEAFPAPRNGWWLSEALKALPRPLIILPVNDVLFLAGNASPELATLLVGTDGAGLGFGQFRGSAAYHTILDNPERLDPRSLQHQGFNALSLTRHFGNLPLNEAEQQATPSLVAFNVWPGGVVAYPSTWALSLAVAIAVLFAAFLGVGFLRGRLKVGALLLGIVLFVLGVIGTVVVTTLAWKFGIAINPTYQVWMGRGYYGADWHLLYFTALTVAFFSALYLLARRFIRAARNDESTAAGRSSSWCFSRFSPVWKYPRLATSSPGPRLRGCSY